MGSHPNVILKLTIKPQGTTRRTLRELLQQNREEILDLNLPLMLDKYGEKIMHSNTELPIRIRRDEQELCIGEFCYQTLVMETDYDEGVQISGEEGDLIIYDLVTYGYGEEISWEDLQSRVDSLEVWSIQHNLEYRISVSANYW